MNLARSCALQDGYCMRYLVVLCCIITLTFSRSVWWIDVVEMRVEEEIGMSLVVGYTYFGHGYNNYTNYLIIDQ